VAQQRVSSSARWARQVELLSLAEGFFPSTVLFALVRLRVFERLGEGEKTLDDLARELGARPATLARLLRAGVVLNLLESEDGLTFRAAAIARPSLVSPAAEGYLGDWIRGLDEFRAALSRLDQAVLSGEPTVDPAAHLGADEARTRSFAAASAPRSSSTIRTEYGGGAGKPLHARLRASSSARRRCVSTSARPLSICPS